MPRHDGLKRKLFAEGVAAAASALGLVKVYVCPICSQRFAETAIADGRLTLEDVPPKAIGGRPIILACKRCNNTAGHSVDVHAVKRASVGAAVASLLHDRVGPVGDADLILGDAKLRGVISVDEQKTRKVKILPSRNNPASVAEFERRMKRHADDPTADGLALQIRLRDTFVPRLAAVSDLRAAYLACVAAAGYTYAFHPALQLVRQQILQPEVEWLARWWFRSKDMDPLSISVSESEGLARVRLREECVALPWTSRAPDRYFQLLEDLQENRVPIDVTDCVSLSWPRSFVADLDQCQ